jgi:hypothetical protein
VLVHPTLLTARPVVSVSIPLSWANSGRRPSRFTTLGMR